MREFAGEFESHVTVAVADAARLEAVAAWARGRGLRFTHIVLEEGKGSQPMLTRVGRGTLAGELGVLREAVGALEAEGYRVVRVKVEASPLNEGVPETDEAAAGMGAGLHFEHHVKVLLNTRSDVDLLIHVAASEGGRVSRNARRVRADGREERFVTQRCYGVGRAGARGSVEALVGVIRAGGFEILEVEEEYVVYDDNIALDAGWIGGVR